VQPGRLAGLAAAAHFVCFRSNADNVVFPPWRAGLPEAQNHLVPGLAHLQMLAQPELMDAVLALRAAPPLAGAEAPLA